MKWSLVLQGGLEWRGLGYVEVLGFAGTRKKAEESQWEGDWLERKAGGLDIRDTLKWAFDFHKALPFQLCMLINGSTEY